MEKERDQEAATQTAWPPRGFCSGETGLGLKGTQTTPPSSPFLLAWKLGPKGPTRTPVQDTDLPRAAPPHPVTRHPHPSMPGASADYPGGSTARPARQEEQAQRAGRGESPLRAVAPRVSASRKNRFASCCVNECACPDTAAVAGSKPVQKPAGGPKPARAHGAAGRPNRSQGDATQSAAPFPESNPGGRGLGRGPLGAGVRAQPAGRRSKRRSPVGEARVPPPTRL